MIAAHDHPEFRPVYDAVSALLFVATAHNEDSANFRKTIALCAAIQLGADHKAKGVLSSDEYSAGVGTICRDFRGLTFVGQVLNVCEAKQTSIRKWYARPRVVSCLPPY